MGDDSIYGVSVPETRPRGVHLRAAHNAGGKRLSETQTPSVRSQPRQEVEDAGRQSAQTRVPATLPLQPCVLY